MARRAGGARARGDRGLEPLAELPVPDWDAREQTTAAPHLDPLRTGQEGGVRVWRLRIEGAAGDALKRRELGDAERLRERREDPGALLRGHQLREGAVARTAVVGDDKLSLWVAGADQQVADLGAVLPRPVVRPKHRRVTAAGPGEEVLPGAERVARHLDEV